MQGIRNAIIAHNNATLPDPPAPPRVVAYGNVALTQQGTLLDHIRDLFPGKGIYSQVPQPMEDYGEGCAWLPCPNMTSSHLSVACSGCALPSGTVLLVEMGLCYVRAWVVVQTMLQQSSCLYQPHASTQVLLFSALAGMPSLCPALKVGRFFMRL